NQRNKYQNKGRGLICWLCVFLKVGGYLTSQSGVAFAFAHLTPHSIEPHYKYCFNGFLQVCSGCFGEV
ncbi:MAG: hypothetical protein ACPMAG_13385, partial [Limisphaerales bacterium]